MANLKKQNIPFTQIANAVINDTSLSWKAKGLFAYLYSKPDGWDFAGRRISKDSSDGSKSTYSGLKELESKGYILRSKHGNGRVTYLLKYLDYPDVQMGDLGTYPDVQNGKLPKRLIAETGTISNKDTESNKEKKVIPSDGQAIAEIIDMFKDINPSFYMWYHNTTQRKSVSTLLERYGKDKLMKAVALLPQTNRTPYITTITSPYQLESKWAVWESQIKKKMAEKNEKGKQIISST